MGSEESKAQVQHNGDSHIEFVNTQLEHTTKLDANSLMLWIILAVVALQLAITMWLEVHRHIRKNVAKKASKLVKLAEVIHQKWKSVWIDFIKTLKSYKKLKATMNQTI